MSIHAQLSPEAQARFAAQRRNSTITSVVISILVIVILGLLLGIFLLPTLIKETPTIVTYQANETKEKEPEPEKIKSAIQRKPSAPSSSMVKVIAASTTSTVSIPVPEVAVETQSVDFGDGDDFGSGWGDGNGSGKGGGGSFFNQKVSAERIVYVIDYSASMKGEKDQLMRDELSKSVNGLSASTKYQMIFFSGPAWVAGSDATAKGNDGSVKAEGGQTFKWSGKGAHDWKPVGKMQKAEWLDMSAKQMTESLEVIKETKLVYGTDWTNPLEMAFDMDPAPQIVFFMTDGSMSGRDMMAMTKDLADKANKKRVIVNCIAMMEPKAQEPMFELAKETGGAFTIVEAGGKIREVKSLDKKKK